MKRAPQVGDVVVLKRTGVNREGALGVVQAIGAHDLTFPYVVQHTPDAEAYRPMIVGNGKVLGSLIAVGEIVYVLGPL